MNGIIEVRFYRVPAAPFPPQDGRTPLIAACIEGEPAMSAALLAAGASPHAARRVSRGETFDRDLNGEVQVQLMCCAEHVVVLC